MKFVLLNLITKEKKLQDHKRNVHKEKKKCGICSFEGIIFVVITSNILLPFVACIWHIKLLSEGVDKPQLEDSMEETVEAFKDSFRILKNKFGVSETKKSMLSMNTFVIT